MIDIVMTTFNRRDITRRTLGYLAERTKTPFRLFVIDNNSDDGTDEILKHCEGLGIIFLTIYLSRNVGIHAAKNIGMGLVRSDYYVDTDNDLYVPKLEPDWLARLKELMDKNPDYGAIACQPHVFLGASAPKDSSTGVTQTNMCGAVFRIARTALVRKVGGWKDDFLAKRNDEERTICSKIQNEGFKVGYANHIKCFHDFGDDNNWGYGIILPHDHGHREPGKEIWPPPISFHKQAHLYDGETWEKK